MPSKLNLRDSLDESRLDLSMSDLKEVPVKDIAVIKKATTLDLSNNRLTTLGKSFCSLIHLVKLDLGKNQLRQLPENFGDLIQLKHLDLYSNQLNHLPLSLSKLKSLRWLDLKSNPLVPAIAEVAGPCLDPKQCQQCARSVVTFLQGMQVKVDQERQRLLQVKQKQQEQAELVAQAQKKEQQQQKKKKKAAKSANIPQAKVENGIKSAPISGAGNQGGSVSKKSNAQAARNKNKNNKSNAGSGLCWRLLKLSLVLTTLVSMGLMTLFMVDRKMFSLMIEGFGQRWKVAVDSLPPQMAQPLEVFANGTVNAIQVGYVWLSTNAQVQSFLSTTKSLLDVAYVKVLEAYQTVNHQLPVYVDTLKKKFM